MEDILHVILMCQWDDTVSTLQYSAFTSYVIKLCVCILGSIWKYQNEIFVEKKFASQKWNS